MSSPKKDDYKASETEKTSASIALADKTYFNESNINNSVPTK